MHRVVVVIIALTLLALPAVSLGQMDLLGELSVSGGYTQNLLNDSSDVHDSFSSYSGSARFYPLPSLELNGNTSYTYYGKYYNLANLTGGVGFIFIPTKDESPFSLYLSSNYDGHRYREEFQAFDNNTFDATVSAGYRLLPALSVRAGYSWRTTAYLYSQSGDKEDWEVFSGINFTPYGRNSLDLEVGFGNARYYFVPVSHWGPPYDLVFDVSSPDALLRGGGLQSLYVAPRYSRPIGFKTGLNVTYTYRTFLNSQDGLVFGTTIGLLSPWTSVWEGNSVAINIKSYLIPTVTFSAGFGYWEKTFLSTLEDYYPGDSRNPGYAIIKPIPREDNARKFYIQFQRPFRTFIGTVQPNIRIDYVDNNSTNELYDYSGYSLSVGLSYQL